MSRMSRCRDTRHGDIRRIRETSRISRMSRVYARDIRETSHVYGHIRETSHVYGHIRETSHVCGHIRETSHVCGHIRETSRISRMSRVCLSGMSRAIYYIHILHPYITHRGEPFAREPLAYISYVYRALLENIGLFSVCLEPYITSIYYIHISHTPESLWRTRESLSRMSRAIYYTPASSQTHTPTQTNTATTIETHAREPYITHPRQRKPSN